MKGISNKLAPNMDKVRYDLWVQVNDHKPVKVAWYYQEWNAKRWRDFFHSHDGIKSWIEKIDPEKDLEDYKPQARDDID